MKIIATLTAENPENAAYAFGAMLAVDNGVPNTVRQRRDGWLVVADDNRAILFKRAA